MRAGFWYRLVIVVVRPLLRALTVRDWQGLANLPATGGFVLCPNHVSYIDPLIVAHLLVDQGRPGRFLAKAELFELPVIGRLLRGAGQIPVYRASREASAAYQAAVQAVRDGECVIVYPEGTITRDPQGWPMVGKTGAARIALATGAPVVPLAQWGPQELLAPYARRLRLGARTRVHLRVCPPVDLSAYVGLEPTPEVLRAMTAAIMRELAVAVGELRGQVPPAEQYDPKRAGQHSEGISEP